jgi:hypothetical protein
MESGEIDDSSVFSNFKIELVENENSPFEVSCRVTVGTYEESETEVKVQLSYDRESGNIDVNSFD